MKDQKKDWMEEYEKRGVDISLLVSNLKKTPTERLEDNLNLSSFVGELRKAGLRAQAQRNLKYSHSK